MYNRQRIYYEASSYSGSGRQPLPGYSCLEPFKLLILTPIAQADLATRHATPSLPVTAEGAGHVTGSRNCG